MSEQCKEPQAHPARCGCEPVESGGVSIERDFVGTMHIKVGEFDAVQVRYQYPYTDNASTRRLAERIADMLRNGDKATQAQQALAPESQRVVPVEPLLAPRHPFDRPSVLKDSNVEYSAGAQLPSIRMQRQKLLADVEAGVTDQIVRDRLVALGWTPPGGEPRLVHVPVLDEHLRYILGRPNFWCYHLANALRAMGQEIARKAEEEQAAVIHFLLKAYFEHGPGWREAVEKILAAEREKELAKGGEQ